MAENFQFRVFGQVCEIIPSEMATAERLVAKLDGTTFDPEEIVEKLADEGEDIDLTLPMLRWIDSKIARCDDCDYWTPIGYLRGNSEDRNGLCEGCS